MTRLEGKRMQSVFDASYEPQSTDTIDTSAAQYSGVWNPALDDGSMLQERFLEVIKQKVAVVGGFIRNREPQGRTSEHSVWYSHHNNETKRKKTRSNTFLAVYVAVPIFSWI